MNLIGNINAIPFRRFRGGGGVAPIPPFPSIPGMIARYSALGLTNEHMKENPVWVDKTGNGRDLQLKNFAWGGMSGVNGYVENYNNNRWIINSIIDAIKNSYSFKITQVKQVAVQIQYISLPSTAPYIVPSYRIKVIGLTDGQTFNYRSSDGVTFPIVQDGVYELPEFEFSANGGWFGFQFNKVQESCNITIEQLPLYPGALVFDGVDDYGTCDNFPILTKEKGYTVVALRQRISTGEGIRGLVSNVKNWFKDGAFILEYSYTKNSYFNRPVSFGAIGGEKDLPHILTYQTSKSYNGVSIAVGSFIGTDQLYVGKIDNIIGNCTNAAIWELVFLDHDATEEELTKIKDYFVKTYPWLFPDQAWTVVGKTNEDEDRATIANITGNGNDLVLSNFGFAKNSGYGLYNAAFSSKSNLQYWSKQKIQFSKSQIETNKPVPYLIMVCNDKLSYNVKIKMTGFDSGVKLKWGFTDGYTYIEGDGIHVLNKKSTTIRYLHIEYSEDFDPDHVVTIEQIPEYEGYLVTDGVDDKIVSSVFGMGKDFTIVGDWKFIDNKKSGTGLVKGSSFYIYNTMIGLDLYINSGSVKNSLDGIKSINAACSDGRVYDRNWNEILANTGNVVGSGGTLEVSSSGGRFDRIAFKNLAIYPRILSKDDCIKAYNYLQTLKAK